MNSPNLDSSDSGSSPAGGRRRAWIALLLVPVFLLSAYHFIYGLQRSYVTGYAADVPIFAEQTHAYLKTGVLYPDADRAEAWEPGAHVFKYPPFYAMWLMPFVGERVPQALYDGLWWMVLALFVASCVLGVYLFPGRRVSVTILVVVLMALNFEPFLETLWHIQLETGFLFAFLLALFAYQRGHDKSVGVLIGLCGSLKVYPAFLLLFFVVRGRWKVVGSAIVTAILCLLASYIVVGRPAHLDYFIEILPVMLAEAPSLITKNQGLARYVCDLTGWSPELSKRVGQVIGLGLVALTVVCVRRNRASKQDRDVGSLELAMFIGLMSLTMPNFWSHYQVILLLPFLAVWHAMPRRESLRHVVGPMLLVAFASTLFYSPCASLDPWAPCAQTPFVLGLFQLSRPFHDALVHLKVVANIVAWLAPLILLWGWPGRQERAAV